MQKHAIIIEDDSDDLYFLNEAIKELKYDQYCRTFDDPCDAVSFFEAENQISADIVLIDYSMPVMNGLECLEKLVKLPKARAVRFVIYSSSALPGYIENAIIQLGGQVVLKPNSYRTFQSFLQALLAD